MKKLYIIKAGSTFPATAKQFGEFDQWTATLGMVDLGIDIMDARHGASLPTAQECAGAVITGSHSMVTENLSWSVKLEEWIPFLLKTCTLPFRHLLWASTACASHCRSG